MAVGLAANPESGWNAHGDPALRPDIARHAVAGAPAQRPAAVPAGADTDSPRPGGRGARRADFGGARGAAQDKVVRVTGGTSMLAKAHRSHRSLYGLRARRAWVAK